MFTLYMPESVSVDLFGKRVFTDIIKGSRDEIILNRMAPKANGDVLIREKQGEIEDRGEGHVMTSQGAPTTADSYKKLGKTDGTDSPIQLPEETNSTNTLASKLLAFRTVRE